MTRVLPRFPIYVPSKGRSDDALALTVKMFITDEVPFYLVVEPQEVADYSRWTDNPYCQILTLPFSDMGSVIPTRNWIKHHSIDVLHADRHWQVDDNIRRCLRLYRGKRLNTRAGVTFRIVEDFALRYTNVAVAGMNYSMFVPERQKQYPFVLNARVYSSSLILNSLDHEWRGRYNEDTDYCLQVLADGYCTILTNAFMVDKIWTMRMAGGNTDELYKFHDGRLKMARSLERQWPGVVRTGRRFQRPQHIVKNAWKSFDNELIRDPDWVPPDDPEYGMELKQVAPIKSDRIAKIMDDHHGSG